MNRRNRDNLRILLFTLGFLLAGLLMFSVTIAKADEPTTLRFEWGYDPAAEALIGGFWLYVNNQQMTTGIPPRQGRLKLRISRIVIQEISTTVQETINQ